MSVLIVFELLQPYAPEITTILGLPTGFDVRFRFKRRWFATVEPLKLASRPGLIALRITATTEILPLRFCRIKHVIDIGDIFYLVAAVGEYAELNPGEKGQAEQLARFNASLRDGPLKEIKNHPTVGMEKLVFLGPPYASHFGNPLYVGDSENREISAWGTLVEVLIKLEAFKLSNFLYVLGLDARGVSTKLNILDGQFKLRAEWHYRLRVVQRRAQVQPASDFVLNLDETALHPILARQKAVGAYDILEFSFQTSQKKTYEQRTALVLDSETPDGKAELNPLILPAYIPRSSLIWNGILVALFIIAAVVLLFPTFVAYRLHVQSVSEESRNAAIIAMIVTSKSVGVIGSGLVSKAYQIWR